MTILKINGKQYPINLNNNRTVSSLVKQLPIKISYQPFNDIEVYGKASNIIYDETDTSTNAIAGQLKYCLEYNSIVLVCRNHHDIFNEVDIGTVKISQEVLNEIAKSTGSFTIDT